VSASGGSAPPETITIVQDAHGRPLTKSFRRLGGRLVKGAYPNSSEFRALVAEVHNLTELAGMLDAVVSDGHAAVIRGEPGRFYPGNGSPVYRLLHRQEGLVAARTGARISTYAIKKYNLQADHDNRWAVTWLPMFEDAPRAWTVLDVDRVPVREHMSSDWVDEPEAAVEHVLGLLPEPFRTATCWWSLSSSAALPEPSGRVVSPTFKLKLAFWLDRPLTGAELKRWMWAENAPVDPAVFNAIQLIYLARPKLGDDVHDPVPRRTGMWRGETDVVEVPELLPEADPYNYEATGAAAGFEPAEGLEELVDQIRGRLQGELHVREHLMAAARSYIRQHGANVEQAPVVAALEGVAREFRSPGDVAGYGVDRLVEHVVRQERAATWMPFDRPPRPARLAPYFGTEGTNMFAEIGDQRRFLRSWINRQHLFAVARREIATLRGTAFAAEGLAA
jgi:hypothetical protein